MISFNLRASLTIAIICFVLGCCTAFLLAGSCGNSLKQENFVKTEILKQRADSIERFYQEKVTELEVRNHQLQQELTVTKAHLNTLKSKTKQKEATIKKITKPKGYPARRLLNTINPSSVATVSLTITCDSLVQEINEYMELNAEKEVYYEAYITIQDSIIAGNDSIIAFKTTEHSELKKLFDHSVYQQQILLAENNRLHKRLKREKGKGKLLAFGTAILSGLTFHYLTK